MNFHFRSKKKGLMLLSLLLVVGMAFRATPSTWAQTTNVKVINPATGDGNFTLYGHSVGTRFNATAWVYNVTDLFAYQVKLNVNDTLLNITRAWRPTWDTQWVYYGKSTVGLEPSFYDIDSDGSNESVLVGDSSFTYTFNGDGLLAVIEFQIIYVPLSGNVSCNLNITNVDTTLLNSDLVDIVTGKTSGYYIIPEFMMLTLLFAMVAVTSAVVVVKKCRLKIAK